MEIYKCEACGKPVSRGIGYNSLRFRGVVYCLIDQAVFNELKVKNRFQADILNKYLFDNYHVDQDQVEEHKKLSFWKKYK